MCEGVMCECLYCGGRATTREHVLPRWLLEMTGGMARQIHAGRNWTVDQIKPRFIPAASLWFGACDSCRRQFRHLDERAKPIVEALIEKEPVNAGDIDRLLDWLDKVRVGLWLGLRSRERNVSGITPKFRIRERLGTKDRLLSVELLPERETRLTAYCADTPIFQVFPSMFALRINGVLLINASSDFLISWQFGLPCPEGVEGGANTASVFKLNPGTGGFSIPAQPIMIRGVGPCFFQAIAPLRGGGQGDVRELYETEWARGLGLDFDTGKCHVYYAKWKYPEPYPDDRTKDWVPFETLTSVGDIAVMVLLDQDTLYDFHPSGAAESAFGQGVRQRQRAIIDMCTDDQRAFRNAVEIGDLDPG